MISTTDPLGYTESYSYDPAGNRISLTDKNGNTITYGYDVLNWLILTSYPDGSDVTNQYDAAGNLIQTINTGGIGDITTYQYDNLNRVTLTETNYGSFSKVINYSYDNVGNRTNLAAPGGIITWNYDALNRIVNIIDQYAEQTDFGYDGVGNRVSISYPNNITSTSIYDGANRLTDLTTTSPTGGIIQSFVYEYDPVGSKTKETHEDGSYLTYAYDDVRRLVNETNYSSGDITSYTYDPAGNRATKDVNGDITYYEYDDNNRVISAGDLTYLYDYNCNRMGMCSLGDTVFYEYDYENRLTMVTFPDFSFSLYNYSADGRRLSVYEQEMSKYYVYDNNHVLEELDDYGYSYVTHNPGISVTYVYDIYTGYLHYNHNIGENKLPGTCSSCMYGKSRFFPTMSSTTLSTDNFGEVIGSVEYDEFGNITDFTGWWVNDDMWFRGMHYEMETELYNIGWGYIDPYVWKGLNCEWDPVLLVETKCCGVKKFIVKWKKSTGLYPGNLIRIDVEIEFMNDATHDPACCEYRQNVKTSWSVTAGPHKGQSGGTKKWQDDNYSRGDDTDGKKDKKGNIDLSDPGFTTNDNPGLKGLHKNDVIDYSFSAEQMVIEICAKPCPKGKTVAKRGPHTVTVKGKEPRTYTGVPKTLK